MGVSTCISCGVVNDPRAEVCRDCHRLRVFDDTADRDALILGMRAEGLSLNRIARRLHIARPVAHRAVRRAQRRTALRESQ